MSVLDWIKSIVSAISVALGLAEKVEGAIADPKPQLMEPPPPADSNALVHDLTEIRKQKFGK